VALAVPFQPAPVGRVGTGHVRLGGARVSMYVRVNRDGWVRVHARPGQMGREHVLLVSLATEL